MNIVFKELHPDGDGFPTTCKEINTTEFFSIELHTSSGIFNLSDNEDGSVTLRIRDGIMLVHSENNESITLTNKPYKEHKKG